jgi:hypothetical protein
MREPGYTMTIMAMGGSLFMDESFGGMGHNWEGNSNEFQFTILFDWHFHHCHAIDDHNNLQQKLAIIDLVECFLFSWWSVRAMLFS